MVEGGRAGPDEVVSMGAGESVSVVVVRLARIPQQTVSERGPMTHSKVTIANSDCRAI